MISVLRNINKPVDPEFRFTIEIAEDPSVADPNYFIDNPGESIEDYTNFRLPLTATDSNYDFTVDWGDSQPTQAITNLNYTDTYVGGDQDGNEYREHTYGTPGIYTITISGVICQRFYFNADVHAKQMREVQNWGIYTVGTNANNAFYGCTGMTVTANDTWDTTGAQFFQQTFRRCLVMSHFPGIENWDMSSATTFDNMFYNCQLFNSNISNWKPDLVTDMSGMFLNCYEFDQPVGNWDMTNCTMVNGMFQRCRKFNRPLTNWNARSNFFENLNATFYDCREFDQDLSGWMTASPVCDSLNQTFRDCWVFDNLGQSLNVWDTSNVLDMQYCFFRAKLFNRPLSNWNTAEVSNMRYMFNGAVSFNQPLATSGSFWNTAKVTNMEYMFSFAYEFDSSVAGWDTLLVQYMNNMFFRAEKFNQPLATSGNVWNVSTVEDFSGMFREAYLFNQDLSTWDTSSATNMSYMFYNIGAGFNQSVNTFNMASVESISHMFMHCLNFNQPVNTWNTSSLINAENAFNNTSFNQSMTTIGSVWDVSLLENAAGMFRRADLTGDENGLSTWVTSSLQKMSSMFFQNTKFNGNIGGWNVTNVTEMSYVFYNCLSFDKDLSSWTTGALTTIEYAFFNCNSFNSALSRFNTSLVTNFNLVFNSCDIFNNTLNWDTSNGQSFIQTFAFCPMLKQNLATWLDVSSATNMSNFLLSSDINDVGTTTNYDALLASMVADTPITGVKFHGGNSDYSATGKISRDLLENTDPPPKGYSWIIEDGDLV